LGLSIIIVRNLRISKAAFLLVGIMTFAWYVFLFYF
jgi:hypothetical protein